MQQAVRRVLTARGGGRRRDSCHGLLALALAAAGCGAPPPLVAETVAVPERRFAVGNEARHDLFAPILAGRGGGFVCVGGDHCYTLLALAEADWAVLLDHDPRVVALHHELGRRVADDASALLAGLDTPPADPELAARWQQICEHLRRVAGRESTWLGDPSLYTRVRSRWQAGAVIPLLGDLAGDIALSSIAANARARGIEFTAVYLSNAEETITDRGRLRRNLAALPRSPDGVLLRTFFLPDWPAADGLWSYQIHTFERYLARAGDPPAELAVIVADARARGELHVDPAEPALSTIARP